MGHLKIIFIESIEYPDEIYQRFSKRLKVKLEPFMLNLAFVSNVCIFQNKRLRVYEKKKKPSDNELKRYKTQVNIGDIC